MWFRPSNPSDAYHSQLEMDNFREEQAEKKRFMANIENIAKAANKKSWFSIVMSILSFLVALAALIITIIEKQDMLIDFF